ncbi:MAG: hypothetical protein WC817_00890 [Patescibacteria group bacterium]|jgi:hypothetical protein
MSKNSDKINPLHISQAFGLNVSEDALDFFDANLFYDSRLFFSIPFRLQPSSMEELRKRTIAILRGQNMTNCSAVEKIAFKI